MYVVSMGMRILDALTGTLDGVRILHKARDQGFLRLRRSITMNRNS